MPTGAHRIEAKDFIRESRPVVECAADLSHEVVRQLRAGASVVVSVHGVRGVSSSFFNVLLKEVGAELGGNFGSGRFDVDLETATQRMIYERSRAAFASTNSAP